MEQLIIALILSFGMIISPFASIKAYSQFQKIKNKEINKKD